MPGTKQQIAYLAMLIHSHKSYLQNLFDEIIHHTWLHLFLPNYILVENKLNDILHLIMLI